MDEDTLRHFISKLEEIQGRMELRDDRKDGAALRALAEDIFTSFVGECHPNDIEADLFARTAIDLAEVFDLAWKTKHRGDA